MLAMRRLRRLLRGLPAACSLRSPRKSFKKVAGKKGALLMLYSYSRWYIILLFQGHVAMILMVFSCSGVILAMIELLGVVLACCLATIIADENKEKLRLRRINQQHLDLKVSDLWKIKFLKQLNFYDFSSYFFEN